MDPSGKSGGNGPPDRKLFRNLLYFFFSLSFQFFGPNLPLLPLGFYWLFLPMFPFSY